MNRVVLKGDLQFISLPDILQLLGSNNATGSLHISSKYAATPALIYFDKGSPIQAASGEASDLDAIYSLFAWTEGMFEFKQEPMSRETRIHKNSMEIILEGLRLLDDGHIQPLTAVTYDHAGKDASGSDILLPVIHGSQVEFVDVVDEDVFHDGETIVTQGMYGNWIWVILEGNVDIIREAADGSATIVRIGPGCFIGSLFSFLFEGNIRSATAVARGEVLLGVLNSQRLSREYSTAPADLRNLLISLERRLRQVSDKAVGIHFNPMATDALAPGLNLLWKQGNDRDEVFEILNGKVFVVHTSGNRHRILCELKQGDFFGHISFIDIGQEPHMASILATKDLKVRQVNSGTLQHDFETLSTTFKNLVHHISRCISVTTKLACDGKTE